MQVLIGEFYLVNMKVSEKVEEYYNQRILFVN